VRLTYLLPLLVLAACGGREEPSPAPEKERPATPAPAPPPAEPSPKDEADAASSRDAVAVLRRYYDHLEAGRYDEAWEMRGGGRAGAEAFARNFAAYERYRVTLGPASAPVEAGGWAHVEVPIQIYGRMRGGETFGSGGTISMRRAAGAPGATARQRGWHIYTGGGGG
jgi:hypothetical protein